MDGPRAGAAGNVFRADSAGADRKPTPKQKLERGALGSRVGEGLGRATRLALAYAIGLGLTSCNVHECAFADELLRCRKSYSRAPARYERDLSF
jgi:hypothetical protein